MYLAVAVDEVEAVAFHGGAHGLEEVVAGGGELSAEDDEFGVEDVDQSGECLAELLPHLLYGFDGEHVFPRHGVEHFVECEGLAALLYARGEARAGSGADALAEFAEECGARHLGFQAAFFAAVAYLLVVAAAHVSQFAGESRLAGVDVSVDDDAQSQSPAQVDEEDVPLSAHAALEVFAVGHGSGVVVDGDVQCEALGESLGEWSLVVVEVGEGVALCGVHAPRHVESHVEDALSWHVEAGGVLGHGLAEGVEAVGVVGQGVGYACLHVHHVAFEVDGGDVELVLSDVHSHEVGGVGVEAVDVGWSSAGGLLLAEVVEVAVVAHFEHDFGGGGHAEVELLRQLGYGGGALVDVAHDDALLGERALAALLYLFEELLGHGGCR